MFLQPQIFFFNIFKYLDIRHEKGTLIMNKDKMIKISFKRKSYPLFGSLFFVVQYLKKQ